MSSRKLFTRMTEWAARESGEPISTVLAFLIIVIWLATGPLFRYSDTWQLVINTVTTLVTFLMVFLIQSSQNRGSAAVQIKLDEIIRAIKQADNSLLSLEELDEADLDRIRAKYGALAKAARKLSKKQDR